MMSNISNLHTQQISTGAPRADAKPSALYGDKAQATNAADFFGLLLSSFLSPATRVATPVVQTTPLNIDTTFTQIATTNINTDTSNLDPLLSAENPGPTITDVLMGITAQGDEAGITVTTISPPLQTATDVITGTAAPVPAAITSTPDDVITAQLATLDQTMPTTDVDYEPARQSILNRADAGDQAIVTENLAARMAASTEKQTRPVPAPIATDATPDQDIAAQLNAMTVGAAPSSKDNGKGQDKPVDILSAILQGIRDAQIDGYKPTLTPISTTTVATAVNQSASTAPKPAFSLDPTLDASMGVTGASTWIDPLTQGAGTNSTIISAQTTASKPTSPTSTHSAQAAVQAVAVHLQSMGQTRDTKSLTLQLNPPELGRMQIKMTYGRDKSVTADILVEKSDTYQMMQKDSNTLRDALTNAGLNADAGSLNFTLADHGTFQNRDDTGAFGDIGARGATDDDTIAAYEIKASEEWAVDPSTGITRYNIWV
jgi:hypothetical protein